MSRRVSTHNRLIPVSDLRIIVEESNTCGAEFVIYSLLELYMRRGYKVVFIASANSYAHY